MLTKICDTLEIKTDGDSCQVDILVDGVPFNHLTKVVLIADVANRQVQVTGEYVEDQPSNHLVKVKFEFTKFLRPGDK